MCSCALCSHNTTPHCTSLNLRTLISQFHNLDVPNHLCRLPASCCASHPWTSNRRKGRLVPCREDGGLLWKLLTPTPLAGLSQMAGTQPNGWDSTKWLGLTQMAWTQPNDCDLAKWLQIFQMVWTQQNGWDFIKVCKINPGKEE